VGNPIIADVDVGPLLDEEQAKWCQQQLEQSGGHILCGGGRDGNLLHPTIVEHPAPHSSLVREGLFGSGLWITAGTRDEFVSWWRHNQYPLCAGVLDPAADAAWWLARLPNVARLVVNGDPSVEHIFEPWGGYPASGMNVVGAWHEKYQRVVSVDEAADH
jgi:glyceraldehyde-3-phosphate dehydrogenase (NADP+)